MKKIMTFMLLTMLMVGVQSYILVPDAGANECERNPAACRDGR